MLKDEILEILKGVVSDRDILEANPDADLIKNGLLDSLAFIELLSALDDAYGVEIQPTEINPRCWRTAESITALVDGMRITS